MEARSRDASTGGPPPWLCLDFLVPGLESCSRARCHDSRQLGPGMPADSAGGGWRNSSCRLLSVGDKEAGMQMEHAPLVPVGSQAWASGCAQEPQPVCKACLSCLKGLNTCRWPSTVLEKDQQLGKEKRLPESGLSIRPQGRESVLRLRSQPAQPRRHEQSLFASTLSHQGASFLQ